MGSRVNKDFCLANFDPKIRAAVTKLAEQERRSTSQQIQLLLEEALRARGILKAE